MEILNLGSQWVSDTTRKPKWQNGAKSKRLSWLKPDQIELQHHGSKLYFKNVYLANFPTEVVRCLRTFRQTTRSYARIV